MEVLFFGLLMLAPAAIAWFGREHVQGNDDAGFLKVCIACWLGFSAAIVVLTAVVDAQGSWSFVKALIVFVSQAIGIAAAAAILRRTLRRSRSRLWAVAGALPLGLLAFFLSGVSGVTLTCGLIGCG